MSSMEATTPCRTKKNARSDGCRARSRVAVRVHRDAHRAAIERAEIRDRPARMIFADQRDAFAEIDAFAFKPICDAPDRIEHFGERITSVIFADDLHRHFFPVRFGGVNDQLAK